MKRMSVGHKIMSPYIEVVMKCGNKIIVMRIYQRTKDLICTKPYVITPYVYNKFGIVISSDADFHFIFDESTVIIAHFFALL